MSNESLYDLTFVDNHGQQVSLDQYRGSRCWW